MKSNSTQIYHCRVILATLFLLTYFSSYSQPDYDFRDGTVVAGDANQQGAVYQFNNVKPGVDARVTIVALTSGLWLSDLDGGGGFVEALQPIINIPPYSNGYAELQIDFFYSSTLTPYEQEEVPATPIDVDGYYYGDGYLYEFDMVSIGSGYVNFDGTSPEMHISFAPGWITGTNTSGITYDGIDTAARAVMFTTVNAHISSMIIRVGANNESSSTIQRLRSVYFKKFFYPNSILPVSDFFSFTGNLNENKVKLKWTINNYENKTVILEKRQDGHVFKAIGSWSLSPIQQGKQEFDYTDENELNGRSFYRLKLVSVQGKIQYSNVIYFDSDHTGTSTLTICPTLFTNLFTAQIPAAKSETASLEIFNYSGNKVFQQNIGLSPGQNNIRVDKTDKLPSGIYICIVRTGDKTYSSKIQKQ